jgi:hypothetical protein
MFLVLKELRDRFDGGRVYSAGKIYPRSGFTPPEGRIEALSSASVTPLNRRGQIYLKDIGDVEYTADEIMAHVLRGEPLPIRKTGAGLSALKIGALDLTPDFDPAGTTYTAATSNGTNTITATPEDPAASVAILVNGADLPNGTAATWAAGSNTVEITVTKDTAATVYTVTVEKE